MYTIQTQKAFLFTTLYVIPFTYNDCVCRNKEGRLYLKNSND